MKDYCGKTVSANYMRKMLISKEGVGGKLTFDETGVNFHAHKMNRRILDIRIEYVDMKAAEPRGLLNGLNIITKDDTVHMFVISHRKDIIEYLQSKMN
ncbi:MAG: hypothetical protein E7550_05690 [Ruminococcaceae bacterium]|nr:hypothetical protein [Oscillospiraceae bacterium]